MNMTLSIDNFVVFYFLRPYKAARPFTTSNDSEEHFRRFEVNLNPCCNVLSLLEVALMFE